MNFKALIGGFAENFLQVFREKFVLRTIVFEGFPEPEIFTENSHISFKGFIEPQYSENLIRELIQRQGFADSSQIYYIKESEIHLR